MFFWNSRFFNDPEDIRNLISVYSAFFKTSLNICVLMVHILLKPGLENFEHYFAREIVQQFEHSLKLPFLGIGMKTDLFHSSGHCWVFQICWHIECITFTASSFRVWNSSTGVPSPLLALFIVMHSKAHLTSHSRMFGSRWVSRPLWLSVSCRSFLYSSVYSCHLFLIYSASQVHTISVLYWVKDQKNFELKVPKAFEFYIFNEVYITYNILFFSCI